MTTTELHPPAGFNGIDGGSPEDVAVPDHGPRAPRNRVLLAVAALVIAGLAGSGLFVGFASRSEIKELRSAREGDGQEIRALKTAVGSMSVALRGGAASGDSLSSRIDDLESKTGDLEGAVSSVDGRADCLDGSLSSAARIWGDSSWRLTYTGC